MRGYTFSLVIVATVSLVGFALFSFLLPTIVGAAEGDPGFPTVTLTASPTSITSDQTTTLSWQVTQAHSCNATGGYEDDGWFGSKVPGNSSQQVGPYMGSTGNLSITYRLTCTNNDSGESIAKSVTVSVTHNHMPSVGAGDLQDYRWTFTANGSAGSSITTTVGQSVTFATHINDTPIGGEFWEHRIWWNCTAENDPHEDCGIPISPNGAHVHPNTGFTGPHDASFARSYTSPGTYQVVAQVINRGDPDEAGRWGVKAITVNVQADATFDVTPETGPTGPTSVTPGQSATHTATFTWSQGNNPYYQFKVTQGSSTFKDSGKQSLGGASGSVTRSWTFTYDMAPGDYLICATGASSGGPIAYNGEHILKKLFARAVNTAHAAIEGNDTECKTITVTSTQAPTVDIKAAGSNGPITVAPGSNVTLSWTTTNSPSSCTASNGWTGSKSVSGGNETQNNLTSSKTYTITCSNSAGSNSDSVVVNVASSGYEGPPWDPTCTDGLDNDGDGLTDSNDPDCVYDPTVALTANPTNVTSGGSSTLSWSTSNTVSCTASGDWTGAKNANGGSENRTNITSTKTYYLTCYNSVNESAQASATVTVGAGAVPVVTLTANPTSVSSGGSSTLTWSATNNPTSCTASGSWSGTKNVSGGSEAQNNITSNRTYTLTCTNSAGSGSGTATVSVAQSGTHWVTLLINDKDSDTIPSGQAGTLSWTSSSNMDECRALGDWSGSKNTSGSQSTGPLTSNKTYTLECREHNLNVLTWCGPAVPGLLPASPWTDPDCTYAEDMVTVTVQAGQAPTVSVSASPKSVNAGGTSVITWTTSGANSCTPTASPANANWTATPFTPLAGGQRTSSAINANTTFTLSCTNTFGTTQSQDTVTMNAPGAGPTNLNVNGANACSGGYLQPQFTWTYANQAERQIQIDNSGSGFPSPEVNSTSVTVAQQYTPSSGTLAQGTPYNWRVRARTAGGVWSTWSVGPVHTTHPHRGPAPDFSYFPENPRVNEQVNFNDTSTFYGGATWADGDTFNWGAGGTQTNASEENPNVEWSSEGDKNISWYVTDSDGLRCQGSMTITIGGGFGLPIFREIIPR